MNIKFIISLILNLGALLLIIIKPEYALLIGAVYAMEILWKRIKHKPILKFKITTKSK